MAKLAKFWQWMDDKGYGKYNPFARKNKYQLRIDVNQYFAKPEIPKQMLIGYFHEYCMEAGILSYERIDGFDTIDDLYDFYVSDIEGE